jgi:hypothetical protein
LGKASVDGVAGERLRRAFLSEEGDALRNRTARPNRVASVFEKPSVEKSPFKTSQESFVLETNRERQEEL